MTARKSFHRATKAELRRYASAGGKARAASLTAEQQSAIGRKAAAARWKRKSRKRARRLKP